MGKTKAKAPAKRQASKRPKTGTATTDLLKIADKVAFQSYAAAGIGQTSARAARALQRASSDDKRGNETRENIIIISRALAETGKLSSDCHFALLASLAEDTAWEDARVRRLSKAIEAWHDGNGFADGETVPDGEGPPELEALRAEFDERFCQIQIAVLRHHEADDMVDLLLHDPKAYKARYDQGVKDLQAARGSGGGIRGLDM